MRKLVLYTLMSLDGAVDNPGRYFVGSRPGEAPEFDAVMDDNEAKIIGAQDAVLLGRRTYEEWSQYWPTADNQPFADFINTTTKHVFTSSTPSESWSESVLVDELLAGYVARLKQEAGRDIGVHGSIRLAGHLLSADLVDRLELVLVPTVAAAGRKLLTDDLGVRRLALTRAERSPTGCVFLTYDRPGTE